MEIWKVETNQNAGIEERLGAIEAEISYIAGRNARVTKDKAWEVSTFRRSVIALVTYFVAAVLLKVLGNEYFARNALIPVAGYWLSTLTLPRLKRWWLARNF